MSVAARRRRPVSSRPRGVRSAVAVATPGFSARTAALLDGPGRPFVAALLAIGLVALVLQRVPIGVRPTFLGVSYAQLAANPFHPDPANPVAHRILTPLVSWVLGFRGPYLLYTNLLAVVAFLALVVLWLRSRGHGTWQAFVGAAAMAFSAAVLTTLHYGGYTDTVTYLLVFLAMWTARQPWLSAGFFLLALLNHEAAAFLAPWLLIVMAHERAGGTRWRTAALALVAALVAYGGIRWWMSHDGHVAGVFSGGYYLGPLLADPLHWFRESGPHRALGVFGAFSLLWVLPLLAAAHRWRTGPHIRVVVLLLPIPLALAQLFVAYDVTRVAALAFVAVLLGASDLLLTNAYRARLWVPLLVVAVALAPHVNVAMGTVDVMSR